MATARPFELDIPVVHQGALGPAQTTPTGESPPIRLTGIKQAAVIAECLAGPKATQAIKIHVLRSDDGVPWNSGDAFETESTPGRTTRKSCPLDLRSRFIKVLVENPDPTETIVERVHGPLRYRRISVRLE